MNASDDELFRQLYESTSRRVYAYLRRHSDPELAESVLAGYRAAITDPTSRPGNENWLVLDPAGQIVESGSDDPDLTFTGTIVLREWVDALPDEFVEVLSTDHVEQDIDG